MPKHPTSSMNWERTRSLFPVTREVAYFNNAGVGPISSRVDEALRRYSAEATRMGAFHYPRFFDAEVERVRARAALLLNASADEIAFVKNTTEGLGIVAAGLDWQRGDQVLSCDLEYPSNVYPWWSLRDRGVETVMLRGRDGRLPLAVVEEALRNPRVRLLALSSVEFGSGARNDLEALGGLCRERGVLFCVDAIQSVGCFPIDVENCGIDFLAADGHKWMLSVEGLGGFYISKRVMEDIHPAVVGWDSVIDSADYGNYDFTLKPDATRFEEGSLNTLGIYAFGAALALLEEEGIEHIEKRILHLGDCILEYLRHGKFKILSSTEPGERSGSVCFAGDMDYKKLAVFLREQHVIVSVRDNFVRLSPHF